jgi:hypothetical protein
MVEEEEEEEEAMAATETAAQCQYLVRHAKHMSKDIFI